MVNVRRVSYSLCALALTVCLPVAAQAAPYTVTVAATDAGAVADFDSAIGGGIRLSDPAALIAAPATGAVYLDDPGGADLAELARAMPPGSLLIVNDCGWTPRGQPLNRLATDLALAPADCDAAGLRDAAIAALTQDADAVPQLLSEAGYLFHRGGAAASVRPVQTGVVVTALSSDTVLRLTGAEVIAAGAAATAVQPIIAGGADHTIQPRRAGLPEPSIIVGELARLLAPGRRGPLGLAFADREALRALDPARFQQMLDGGGFDPEPGQIAVALQTELQRMNCYTGRIDGDWGRGSSEALRRYFQTIGAAQASTTADISAFRAIARQAPAECPAPAAAQPVARSPAPATQRQPATTQRAGTATPRAGGTTASRAPAAARPAPSGGQPPAAASSGGPRIGNRLGGAGMFR